MSTASEIQVRLEEGTFPRGKAGNPLVDGFRIVRFVRKSPDSGHYIADKLTDKFKTFDHRGITVFGVAKPDDVERFVRVATSYVKERRPMIAVASPAIFNVPEYRDAIEGLHLPGAAVLVQDPLTFTTKELAPWLDRVLVAERGPKKKAAPAVKPVKPLPAPLDVSARLRDPVNGRLDAGKISELLGISKSDLAKVCGVSRQALGQNPTSAGLQEKLQPLEDIAQALSWCGGDEARLRAWLRSPNRDFPLVDGKTPSPVDLIMMGHAMIVARKVENLRTGHPA